MDEIIGSLMTRWTCEECDAVHDEEGDAAGDEVSCSDCGADFKITEVK